MKKILHKMSSLIFLKSEDLRQENKEKPICSDSHDLLNIPRYTKINILNDEVIIEIPDAISYYYAYKEIYEKGIYRFTSNKKNPRIIDCGANIGLSVLFFKKLFPEAAITAFEADPKIYTYLKNNINAFGHQDVLLIQKAISNQKGEALFLSEGADAGRLLMEFEDELDGIRIPCITLDEILDQEVDFLKIDIEGAETDVIIESKNLNKVKNMFVEYHSFSSKAQCLHNLLAKISDEGFRYHITTVFSSKNPFLSTDNYLGMDLQLNISCVRRDN
jgi:FkbM family methyltransferase